MCRAWKDCPVKLPESPTRTVCGRRSQLVQCPDQIPTVIWYEHGCLTAVVWECGLRPPCLPKNHICEFWRVSRHLFCRLAATERRGMQLSKCQLTHIAYTNQFPMSRFQMEGEGWLLTPALQPLGFDTRSRVSPRSDGAALQRVCPDCAPWPRSWNSSVASVATTLRQAKILPCRENLVEPYPKTHNCEFLAGRLGSKFRC